MRNQTSGGTSQTAVRSGPAIAMFFGTISPITMCRTVTTDSAMTNAIGCSTASGTPSGPNTSSSRCATAGSPSAPSASEQIVIPSWAAASIIERCSLARSTVPAPEVPASTIVSRRSRRAEISANSAPTKKRVETQQRDHREQGAARRSRRHPRRFGER